MKIKILISVISLLFLFGCVGTSTSGVFGTGVSIAMDPRTLGTQIDDSIMDKSLDARLLAMNKNYFISLKTKVLDGRIFITGKVETPEEKLKITKIAWETKGARSVKNDLRIKENFNFKRSAKDVLITSQLRTALIFNFSSGLSTLPVINILPSKTLEFIDKRYFLSTSNNLALRFFCMILSSI